LPPIIICTPSRRAVVRHLDNDGLDQDLPLRPVERADEIGQPPLLVRWPRDDHRIGPRIAGDGHRPAPAVEPDRPAAQAAGGSPEGLLTAGLLAEGLPNGPAPIPGPAMAMPPVPALPTILVPASPPHLGHPH
jgi:hypothetical protein